MSDNVGSPGAGWFYAEGDPPGTQRYWDGTAWQGEPQRVQAPAPAPQPPAPQPLPPPSAPSVQAPFGTPTFAPPGVEKRRSRWKLVVGLIVGLMVLVGGCTFFLWRAVSGPIDAGNDFLAAVQAKDFAQARELTDATCFENGPDVVEEVFGPVIVVSYRLTGTNVQFENGVENGSTSGEITFAGGDTRTIELFMVERDGWRVCGFDIGPAGGG